MADIRGEFDYKRRLAVARIVTRWLALALHTPGGRRS